MADKQAKDLDFDELHKAVNALMDRAQKGSKPKPALASGPVKIDDSKPDEPVKIITSEPPKATQPEPAKPEEDHSVKVNVKRPAMAVVAHRVSHGRAMDVVGPRERPEAVAPPSERAKHLAPTLQPTKDIKPDPVALVIVPNREEPPLPEDSKDLTDALDTLDLEVSTGPDSTQSMTHQKSIMPEPANKVAEAETGEDMPAPVLAVEKPVAEEPPVLEPAPTVEPEKPEVAEADEPAKPESNSPFLTTKVDKRPLGAYTDAPKPESAEKPEVDEAPEAQVGGEVLPLADQKDVPNPLPVQQQPEEFNPAVVAVENAESDSSQTPMPEPEVLDPAPAIAPELKSEPETESAESNDLRSMAIPQQYKEPEKHDDDSTRPVFDTKEYHPAIEAHTGTNHHRSSIISWVMALVLLGLLVGILGAAYYFMTGDLDFSALFAG